MVKMLKWQNNLYGNFIYWKKNGENTIGCTHFCTFIPALCHTHSVFNDSVCAMLTMFSVRSFNSFPGWRFHLVFFFLFPFLRLFVCVLLSVHFEFAFKSFYVVWAMVSMECQWGQHYLTLHMSYLLCIMELKLNLCKCELTTHQLKKMWSEQSHQ